MRILYITTSFPKPEIGATIYTDLAVQLSEKHGVSVIVSDQSIKFGKYESKLERNIDVTRVGIFPYYNVGFIKKGISAITQSYFLKRFVKKHFQKKTFDLLLYESPPTTNVNVISYLKKLYSCKSYLMLKDIFPQNAVDLRVLKKKSILFKYFRNKEKKLYQVSDVIGCMSQANINYLLQHNNIEENKVKYFPNTKKFIEKSSLISINCSVFKRYDIPKDKKIILFGGNMGKPQYIPLICDLVNNFKDNKEIFFLFIGRGQERVHLENTILKNAIKNTKVIDNLHRDEYESILPFVSIGLVILNPNFTIPNFPSRILSYMENSIPVFAATDKVTDIKDLIVDNKFGMWSYSGDKEEVLRNLNKMIYAEDLKQMGINGYNYAMENFSVEKSVEYIEQHVKELKSNV